jgi:predicted nucleotide-binding protein (sugar kinase/HSP70/actin superfamily)
MKQTTVQYLQAALKLDQDRQVKEVLEKEIQETVYEKGEKILSFQHEFKRLGKTQKCLKEEQHEIEDDRD